MGGGGAENWEGRGGAAEMGGAGREYMSAKPDEAVVAGALFSNLCLLALSTED